MVHFEETVAFPLGFAVNQTLTNYERLEIGKMYYKYCYVHNIKEMTLLTFTLQ